MDYLRPGYAGAWLPINPSLRSRCLTCHSRSGGVPFSTNVVPIACLTPRNNHAQKAGTSNSQSKSDSLWTYS